MPSPISPSGSRPVDFNGMRDLVFPGWDKLRAGKATLRLRSRGPLVKYFQKQLGELGYAVRQNGVFDRSTEAAVRKFQRAQGILVDGVVGKDTAAAIDRATWNVAPKPATAPATAPTAAPARVPANPTLASGLEPPVAAARPAPTAATAPAAAVVATQPAGAAATGPELEAFPIGGGKYNIGWDPKCIDWGKPPKHNSDYYTGRGPNGHKHHRANDVFAPTGAPILAPVTGVISRIRHRTDGGGVTVEIKRGSHYFYMTHLGSATPGLEVGDTVTAGTEVGKLGTSEQAMGTAPHVHFAIHTGNLNKGIDPFPYLNKAR